MSKAQMRDKNPNWRGGRTVTEHGYVLVRAGVGHPLADCRGYAYEHRVVAQTKIGRPLQKSDIIHHLNGNRQDNRPENIIVTRSVGEHALQHRSAGSTLRKPGQRNGVVRCACGCGRKFRRFDSAGRLRKFVSGHNLRVKGHGKYKN